MLFGAISNGRVANAYFFVGPDEEGMRRAADAFASVLNCEGSKEDSCGKCAACSKTEKGIHPDVLTVSPEGSYIKIDQIRELISYTRFGPTEGRFKVCIIDGASRMTQEAANSFLKTLEEPVPGVVFVLLSSSDVGIPQTVLSRCQKIIFSEGKGGAGDIEQVEWIYNEVKSLKSDGIDKMLGLSSRISDEVEDIEGVLETLLLSMWADRRDSESAKKARIIFSTLSAIKKRANVRLALDVMCLSLGEAI